MERVTLLSEDRKMDMEYMTASSAGGTSPGRHAEKHPKKKMPCSCLAVKQEVGLLSNQELLLQVLMDLTPPELSRFQWLLTRKVLHNFAPIPPHWLSSADAWKTTETLLRCYQEDGALRLAAEILRMMGCADQVDELCNRCCRTPVPSWPATNPKPRANCVEALRRQLIDGMQHAADVLDALHAHGLLGEAETEAISIYAARRDKNRALVDMVLRKGARAQQMFYQALSQSEPFLLEELDSISKRQPMPVHVGQLEVDLVSDEQMLLHWLVSQETRGRGAPAELAEAVALDFLLSIVPPPSLGLQGKASWVNTSCEDGAEPHADTTLTEITPEVHEEGGLYRLRCPHAGAFRCKLTGLVLEGDGDVTYQTVPWDRKFLARKGWQPAGPLVRFTCLRGTFHRLHLPHCQILSDGGQDLLFVAHVTEDRVDFIRPQRVTDKNVVISISGFSSFGLVRRTESAESNGPINGMVLLFHQPSDDPELYASLYVVLLPRNALIPQVTREWRKRSGAQYVEALPDCELIPNQTYRLSGSPVQLIQPENAKFLNFEDYDNYTASFEVQLAVDVRKLQLELRLSHSGPAWLPSWLFGSHESSVWSRVVTLRAAAAAGGAEGKLEMTETLLETLNSLPTKELETFQRHLSQRPDPLPVSALEGADSMATVHKLIQKYHADGARDVAVEVLRKMHYNTLASDLQRK
ncbi:uncharacterized protein LOC115357409 [Myripristis murdjan]|uniref:uncharacterized protein LOC115357409 n=1 Tax=Myripristis murdjan TaxID=586833 RepID=UPI00117643EB|nr:uncharacterized protein LOC115357409 [Myripristis murdjan]